MVCIVFIVSVYLSTVSICLSIYRIYLSYLFIVSIYLSEEMQENKHDYNPILFGNFKVLVLLWKLSAL